MKLPTNLLTHVMRGKNGWRGYGFGATLDVGKIVSMESAERSFLVTERHLPFVLNIDYAERREASFLLWLLFDLPPLSIKTRSLSFRYENLATLVQDKQDIIEKQSRIKAVQEKEECF